MWLVVSILKLLCVSSAVFFADSHSWCLFPYVISDFSKTDLNCSFFRIMKIFMEIIWALWYRWVLQQKKKKVFLSCIWEYYYARTIFSVILGLGFFIPPRQCELELQISMKANLWLHILRSTDSTFHLHSLSGFKIGISLFVSRRER